MVLIPLLARSLNRDTATLPNFTIFNDLQWTDTYCLLTLEPEGMRVRIDRAEGVCISSRQKHFH